MPHTPVMFEAQVPLLRAALGSAPEAGAPACHAQGMVADHRDQLVRYEALFALVEDMLQLHSLEAVAKLVVQRLKYLANTSAWRMVMLNGDAFTLVEGYRGRAMVSPMAAPDAWEAFHFAEPRPKIIKRDAADGVPAPPGVLQTAGTGDILVTPFVRGDRHCGLLSVVARHGAFTDLDQKFLRLLCSQLMNHVDGLLMRLREMEGLRHLATQDNLTGALNRGAITELLQAAVTRSRQTGSATSVLLADADHFKRVNDQHGHPAGDAVLRELARRFQAVLRQQDAFGRYGGEEFVFVLRGCNAAQAMQVAERVRQSVEGEPVVIDAATGLALRVTISLGVASNDHDRQASADDLVKCADLALYEAKAGGRNTARLHAAAGTAGALEASPLLHAANGP